MAYTRKNTRSSSSSNEGKGDDWKAQAFINVFLPKKGGGKAKLGGIPLRVSVENHAKVIEWLKADAGNLELLRQKLILTFEEAGGDDEADALDL